MYALGRRGKRRSINIWPGFVDALASLLLVVMFVLMVFMIAQFFLSNALSGKDEALSRLTEEVEGLAELLALERAANADLRINVAQLSSELQSSLAARESLSGQLSALLEERDAIDQELQSAVQSQESLTSQVAALTEERASLDRLLKEAESVTASTREELEATYQSIEADKETIQTQLDELAILKSLRDEMADELERMELAATARELESEKRKVRVSELEEVISGLEESVESLGLETTEAKEEAVQQREEAVSLRTRLTEAEDETQKQISLSKGAEIKINLLNRQIAALRQQLARLAVAIEAIEAANAEKDVQVADLGRRLNVALATKVQELARYRSEFFGRLREVLGERQDVRIVGDRFVFQSELLFETGAAGLGEPGKEQLARLADTLSKIAREIPSEIDWVLLVEGHTDKQPIHTPEFPSNWELSTARAVSVVNFLIEQGISPWRLAAAGFGEFQPLDDGDDEIAFRRNRRIELKLTQR